VNIVGQTESAVRVVQVNLLSKMAMMTRNAIVNAVHARIAMRDLMI
jgi:hypothetical protein